MKKHFSQINLNLNKTLSVTLITLTVISTLSVVGLSIHLNKMKKLGVEAVNYMYNFSDVKELDANMPKLESITTKEVYSGLTIDNMDRALNTYIKFKNVPCKVRVLKNTHNYVLYTLDTDALSSGRKFLFLFDVNKAGKISYVREVEAIDFYGTK